MSQYFLFETLHSDTLDPHFATSAQELFSFYIQHDVFNILLTNKKSVPINYLMFKQTIREFNAKNNRHDVYAFERQNDEQELPPVNR